MRKSIADQCDYLWRLGETVEVMPAVNQAELHPFFQQPDALSLMKEYEVQPETADRSFYMGGRTAVRGSPFLFRAGFSMGLKLLSEYGSIFRVSPRCWTAGPLRRDCVLHSVSVGARPASTGRRRHLLLSFL